MLPDLKGKTKEKLLKQIVKVEKALREHNHKYYALDDPAISDAEYDLSKKVLTDIYTIYPELKPENSVLNEVGSPVKSTFAKVKHDRPMLSLGNAMDVHAVADKCYPWADQRIVIEPKYDGLSLSLKFSKGLLVRATTRGDGTEGEDVTENAKTIEDIPKKIGFLGELEVRGEVYMLKSILEELNIQRADQGLKLFMNTRNAAAGSIRNQDINVVRERKLNFVAWQSIGPNIYKYHSDDIEKLKDLGFNTTKAKVFKANQFNKITAYLQRWEEKRPSLDYEIDGMVFKQDMYAIQIDLGETEHEPKWAFAYKFPPEQRETIVKSIEQQVGRTGIITPVAKLKPVKIGGVMVSSVTIHNYKEIKRLGLMKRDTVIVQRSGDVIPKIIKVVLEKRPENAKKIKRPKECPICGQPTVKEKTYIKCVNEYCGARLEARVIHFSKTLGIDNLGESIIKGLVEEGTVKNLMDVLALKIQDLMEVERVGQKLATKIWKNIDTAIEETTFPIILTALGIPGVSTSTTKDLAKCFKDWDHLMRAKYSTFYSIPGIGEKTAKTLVDWFSDEKNISTIKCLKLSNIPRKALISPTIINKLNNKAFCLTGTMLEPRDNYVQMITQYGGRITGVNSKLDYLVAGENAGSKLAKAKELGIKIINEDQLFDIINNGGDNNG